MTDMYFTCNKHYWTIEEEKRPFMMLTGKNVQKAACDCNMKCLDDVRGIIEM